MELSEAEPNPYWLDDPAAPAPSPALAARAECDLAVVGGGFTGLWTALIAKERDPGREVVLLESRAIGGAATGRNGGFCDASLTHGVLNGLTRLPDELERLEQLGAENLEGIEATVARYGIDCSFERTGRFRMAVADWQLEELRREYEARRALGHDVALLSRDEATAEVHSPTYLGGLRIRGRTAMVNPARLAWGLREACLELGVRVFERTPVTGMERSGTAVWLATPYGSLSARQVALATGASAPLLRRMRMYVLPVYDYVLMTEPLGPERRRSIGWAGREGIGDAGNQFHYYRLTDDDRILFGGYDAVYHYGNGLRDELDQRPQTFRKLAGHLLETFPQLEGVRFTHSWGGAIDTCSRFFPLWGRAQRGRAVYCIGFTGLGVGASRFGARVMLDLLSGEQTELTRLRLVRTKPLPFPPEPLRAGLVNLTRWSLASADRDGGRRNLWLRALDRLGLGFDS